MPVRLNKFLAERLGVSRRKADEWIGSGKVAINGEVATIGVKVDSSDEICYNNEIVPWQTNFVYLAMNKPVGFVCSRQKQGAAETVYILLPKKYRQLKTVGRLDRDSSGLLLFTNDGDFAFQMTHPQFYKIKIYEVKLDRDLTPLHQQMINDYGIDIEDGRSRLGLTQLYDDSRRWWRVEMSEGRNRQIRRTFGALGYTVVKLHRVQFGKYQLNGLKSGDYAEIAKVI